MKLGEVLARFLELSGIKTDDKRIAGLLEDEHIFKYDLNNEVGNELLGKLMNEEIAMNKLFEPAKSKLWAEANNGVEDHVKRTLTDLKWEASAINDLMKGEKTGPKLEAVIKKLSADLESAKKDKTSTPEDIATLRREINELKQARSAYENEWSQKLSSKEAEIESERIDMQVQLALAPFLDRLGLSDAMTAEEKRGLAYKRVSDGIAEKKLKVVLNNKKPKLLTESGTDYYDDANRQVGFEAFAEQQLASILKKAPEPSKPGESIQIPGNQDPSMKAFEEERRRNLAANGVVLPG